MPDAKQSKNSTISARIDDSLRARLDKIIRRLGPNDSSILENLLPAFCDAAEEADAVRWPATVQLAAKQQPMAAEDRPVTPAAKPVARAAVRSGGDKDAAARSAHEEVRNVALEVAGRKRAQAAGGPKASAKSRTGPS